MLVIFFSIVFTIDESIFLGQSQCDCIQNEGECNPYCCCDPYCTEDQKSSFSFCLPEKPGPISISCDPNGRIKSTNINSIHQIIINGINCYYVDEQGNNDIIHNYNFSDFGIQNLQDLVDQPYRLPEYGRSRTSYESGEPLNFVDTTTSKTVNTYLPIGIGSSQCNAYIPILYGNSYPQTECQLVDEDADRDNFMAWNTIFQNLQVYSTPENLIPISPTGQNDVVSYAPFTSRMYLSLDFTNTISQYALNYIQTWPFNLKVNGLAILETRISFRSSISGGTSYDPGETGYHVNLPVMYWDQQSTIQFSNAYRRPLYVGGSSVIFGVDSFILIPLTNPTQETLIQSCLPVYSSDPQTLLQIFASYGNIISGSDIRINVSSTNRSSATVTKPFARWTFMYKKFGTSNKYVNLITKLDAQLVYPETLDSVTSATVEIKFIELNDSGDGVLEIEEDKLYSASFSMIFEFLFNNIEQGIKVLLVFGVIVTIWAYYMFFFEE
ncbi:hypothetical protein GPJ56_001302 [Histomonas meleagridis]|uniref:uncharacterized protein n=1 Tax=Histomonas meleagridis TaxID=135588 RepID=UPI00355A300D|nr:hypothetical protein GPJ56_001302 [Histomonas meleagridis]KAH0805059.1 hypothetical protein GO595_002004 [Histomonas meleagridis]